MVASLTAAPRRRGGFVAAMVMLGFGVAAGCIALSIASRGSAASMSLASLHLARADRSTASSWAPPTDSVASSSVEVVLAHADLKTSPSVAAGAQLSLPISFGQPLAPEDPVPPRKRHWRRHVAAHHRRGSYFLPAPVAATGAETSIFSVATGTPEAAPQEFSGQASADSLGSNDAIAP